MLGALVLYALLTPVPKTVAPQVDRLHTTGYAHFPWLHVGGIVNVPPRVIRTGNEQRLHVTGFAPFPRLGVGGLPETKRIGRANPSSGGMDGLVYGLRVTKKKVFYEPIRFNAVPPIVVPGDFPVQYAGLRVQNDTGMIELCLVAEADAPSGMGGVLKMKVTSDVRVIYLVETTDGNASPVYVRTTTGTKAIRLKT